MTGLPWRAFLGWGVQTHPCRVFRDFRVIRKSRALNDWIALAGDPWVGGTNPSMPGTWQCPWEKARKGQVERVRLPFSCFFPGIRRGMDGFVGMTGFEPAASSSRTKRATGLRYIPGWKLQK
jgi:hypothetical protein